jgi:hypothetical protein
MAKKQQRQHQSGNPARRSPARSGPASAPVSPFRRTLNRHSARPLIVMHGMPRWVVPVAMGLALVLGLFLSGPWAPLGVFLLVLVALFVLWLFALSWPVLPPGGRLARGAVVVALFGLAWLKASGTM